MSDKKVLQLKELDFSGKTSYICVYSEQPYFSKGCEYRPFLFVRDNGMLSLSDDYDYFISTSHKEVNFEYERKLTYKATTKPVQTREELVKVKLKQELLSRIENLEEELTKAHTKLGDL